jgi:ubiquinone/menaquinone biosynthesis C-methylase UbiE
VWLPVAVLAWALASVLAAGLARGDSDDATTHHAFDDVEHWVRIFDDPKRAEWQRPRELVAALGLRPGMRVADVGAGTGYFEKLLSGAVGLDGVVYAVEPEPKLLAHLRERAEREGTANVIPVLGSLDDPRLPPGGVDLVLIVDTYHHIDDRRAYVKRLQRVLAPGGRVAIVDWHKRPLPVGPSMDHKLAREHVVGEMETSGYRLTAEPEVLVYQYFLIFTPGNAPEAGS